jgi:hypothetical protein
MVTKLTQSGRRRSGPVRGRRPRQYHARSLPAKDVAGNRRATQENAGIRRAVVGQYISPLVCWPRFVSQPVLSKSAFSRPIQLTEFARETSALFSFSEQIDCRLKRATAIGITAFAHPAVDIRDRGLVERHGYFLHHDLSMIFRPASWGRGRNATEAAFSPAFRSGNPQ